MASPPEKPLTSLQAARLVYRTEQPTLEQVNRLEKRIQAGYLRGKPPEQGAERWTTTREAVAEYLSRHARTKAEKAVSQSTRASAQEDLDGIADLYQRVLKDYFLAIIFRRRFQQGKTFAIAVIIGQVTILCAVLIACLFALQISSLTESAEQKLIRNWIDQNSTSYSITQWGEPVSNADGTADFWKVEYRYSNGRRKNIQTVLWFLIQDKQIIGVESIDPQFDAAD